MRCPYQNLVESVNNKFHNKIEASCEKFFSLFNLNHFWYFEVTHSGDFFSLGSHIGWVEYLAEENFERYYPFVRNPKFTQYEKIAIFKPDDNSDIKPFLKFGQEHFHLQNSIQIVDTTLNGIRGYGITTSNPNLCYLNHLLNEIITFRLFIDFFRKENSVLFSFLREHQINTRSLLGHLFYENPFSEFQSPEKRAFLKEMGSAGPNSLTAREKEILQFVTKGYSASQIAASIHLSKRTVEHHIERIKNKLSCDSKQQLMGKGRELELLPLT